MAGAILVQKKVVASNWQICEQIFEINGMLVHLSQQH
jgi:hypothetical protein